MSLQIQLGDWYPLLQDIIESKKFKELGKKLAFEYKWNTIYPEGSDIFRAFSLCQLKDVKVIIIGQDPYHDGSANGLAFANNKDVLGLSPSLRNIKKELENDYDTFILDFDPTLENWARQGVLLLNTALTVKKGEPASHSLLWKDITTDIINKIVEMPKGVIFVLWGKHAQSYQTDNMVIYNDVFKAPLPSPFSAHSGFFGCKHFSEINKLLTNKIKWFETQDKIVGT